MKVSSSLTAGVMARYLPEKLSLKNSMFERSLRTKSANIEGNESSVILNISQVKHFSLHRKTIGEVSEGDLRRSCRSVSGPSGVFTV